jgi:hypothetical protein
MCDERERLIGYVYDECDAGERRIIEAHLESCETCREEIGGLRGVRTDLLAWDVPDHGSVWTPFVKARPRPSWREIPVWGLAAAASLMLLAGAAGGAATRAFMAPAPAAAVVPPATGVPDLASLERRINDNLRSEISALDARVRLVSAHQTPAPAIDEAGLLRRVGDLVDQSEQRQVDAVKAVNRDLYHVTNVTSAQIADLQVQLNQLKNQLSLSAPGGSK